MEKKIRKRPFGIQYIVPVALISFNCWSFYKFLYRGEVKMEEYTFGIYFLDSFVLLFLPLLYMWFIKLLWRGRHRDGLLLLLLNLLFYMTFFIGWEVEVAFRCILRNFSVDLFELKRGLLIGFGVIAVAIVFKMRQTVIYEEG